MFVLKCNFWLNSSNPVHNKRAFKYYVNTFCGLSKNDQKSQKVLMKCIFDNIKSITATQGIKLKTQNNNFMGENIFLKLIFLE